jgi:hypothetical protein
LAAGVSARLSAARGRRFGLEVGAAFLLLAGLLWWRGRPWAAAAAGTAGGLLLAAGLAFPARLGPVYRGWMGLAVLLSRVTTPIFMGLVYFAIMTPMGLLARLAGHRPLARPPEWTSYWVRRKPEERRSDLHHQF